MKIGSCVSFGVAFSLLLCFFVLVSGSNKTEADQSQISKAGQSSSVSEVLAALSKQVKELEKIISEMNRRFESSLEKCNEQIASLSKNLDDFKSEISEDHGISFLRPPLRGPPGKDGKQGEKGESGQKGDKGLSVLESITSCSDAMEKSPFLPKAKQTVHPHGNTKKVEVLCDFETDGGGWTIIQKRTSGPKHDFNRTWNEYAKGFGSLSGNFWLGLENIHALTKNGDQELRIQLEDFQGEKRWAKYSNFSISDASDFYRLSLSGFYMNSTVDDSMVVQNNDGQQFAAKDKASGSASYSHCSHDRFGGGWWFPSWCGASSLNGGYFEKGEAVPFAKGVLWQSFKGFQNSLAKTEMKIRKRKSGSA